MANCETEDQNSSVHLKGDFGGTKATEFPNFRPGKVRMPSTSRRLKLVEDSSTRNWLDVPSDVMSNILNRVGVIDRLENAQQVCTAWRKICNDPCIWKVIYMENATGPNSRVKSKRLLEKICKNAVNKSQGKLLDLTIIDFGNDNLLRYIADRSSQLRRLKVVNVYHEMYNGWIDALEKFTMLEELNLYMTEIPKEAIETAGRCCPMLKTLRVNHLLRPYCENDDYDGLAKAIAESLPELRHLELVGDFMTNIGLEAVLDACPFLHSLDLRSCRKLDVEKAVFTCSQRDNIKSLQLEDFLEPLIGCPYISEYLCPDKCLTTFRLLRLRPSTNLSY